MGRQKARSDVLKLLNEVLRLRFSHRTSKPLIPTTCPKQVRLHMLSVLMEAEKLLDSYLKQEKWLRLTTVILLASTYFSLGDNQRCLRYIERQQPFLTRLQSRPLDKMHLSILLHLSSLRGEVLLKTRRSLEAEAELQNCARMFNTGHFMS